jgi:hypothetical protein
MTRNDGDPGTWEAARELGKQLNFPVGPYEARVPTADEMNAVLPYLMDRAARHYEDKYYCENAEIALAHLLGINVPRQGFPRSDGFSRHNVDWAGFSREGYDRDGYDREGYDRYGFDRERYNKEGYNRDGFDRDGFNKKGRDWYGNTREEKVAAEVGGWSDEFAAAIVAHLAQAGVELMPPPVIPVVAKKVVNRAAGQKEAVMRAAVKRAAAVKKAAVRGRALKATPA